LIRESPTVARGGAHVAPVAGVPVATKPPPDDGTTGPVLRDPTLVRKRIDTLEAEVGVRIKDHEKRSGRWEYVASWGALVVALAAALSSASLLADKSDLAVGLSVATAAVAAVNAAFDPQRKATGHQKAARAYHRLDRSRKRLGLETVQCLQANDTADLPAISEQLFAIEDTMDSIADDAPRTGLLF
jgi:hypothetical protein